MTYALPKDYEGREVILQEQWFQFLAALHKTLVYIGDKLYNSYMLEKQLRQKIQRMKLGRIKLTLSTFTKMLSKLFVTLWPLWLCLFIGN